MFSNCLIILQGYSTNTQDNDYNSLHSLCPCKRVYFPGPLMLSLTTWIISGCDVSKGLNVLAQFGLALAFSDSVL